MSLKTAIQRLLYYLKAKELGFVETKLCGVAMRLVPGTTRKTEDQDDAWWFYLSKHHSVIFDIGCNIGYTALLALIQDPNRSIVLVDPNPQALQKAAANIIENGLGSKAQYLAAFVGDTLDDTIKFYTVGAGAAGSMHASHAKTAASIDSFLEVQTVTLDYLYSFYNLKPDLVKIDVEGAETLVMKASKVLTINTQCTFFIEMHTVENLGMKAAAQIILDWCTELNYNAWYPKTGELLPSAEFIKHRGKCHLLLLPKDKEYPSYLKGIDPHASLPKSI